MVNLEREVFGTTKSGEQVDKLYLDNGNVRISLISYGATLCSFQFHDKFDDRNFLLEFPELSDYEKNTAYLGATIGPVAGRIAEGKFEIEEHTISIAPNEGKHLLHSGLHGLHNRVWEAFPFKDDGMSAWVLSCDLPSHESGYPGNLEIQARFMLPAQRDELIIEYTAMVNEEMPVNITNHMYWNLSGSSIYDHTELLIESEKVQILELDEDNIPTGRIHEQALVKDEIVPFSELRDRLNKIDHFFSFSPHSMQFSIQDPHEKVRLIVRSNQNGVQIYDGQFLPDGLKNGSIKLPAYSGFCLECQSAPNSINMGGFPDTVLKPGSTYFWSSHFSLEELP
jgi:aldose 1-epimerase